MVRILKFLNLKFTHVYYEKDLGYIHWGKLTAFTLCEFPNL